MDKLRRILELIEVPLLWVIIALFNFAYANPYTAFICLIMVIISFISKWYKYKE